MRKNIKIIRKIEQEMEYAIDFPIYRKHDITDYNNCYPQDSHIIYSSIDANLRAIHIEIENESKISIEIEGKYDFDGSDIEYHLGKGEHASSREEFEVAIKKAKEIINSIL